MYDWLHIKYWTTYAAALHVMITNSSAAIYYIYICIYVYICMRGCASVHNIHIYVYINIYIYV